jgi:paraquat-inducible protein B
MTEQSPAQPDVEHRRGRFPRISGIWLIPIVALVISLGVAWNSYRSRGPVIEIEFESAQGIKSEETKLRFKDYDVGTVENVSFTDDLSKVVVGVRLDKDIAEYVDEDAKFWLVKAQVGPQGITGLSTVISGVYIEGTWNAEKGERQTHFAALDNPPQTPLDAPGLHIRLRAPAGGSLSVGAPILFKQIPVGKIETVELTDAGDVMVSAFIGTPNDMRLTSQTRFWNASGFSIDLSTAGASLRVDSLASLIQGGVAFDTVNSGGDPVEQGHIYQLYATETDARSTIITEEEGAAPPVEFVAIFDGSVSGLEPGADVQYRGIPVGQVTGLEAQVVERPDGPGVDLQTTFTVMPNRIGIAAEDASARQETLDTMGAGIRRGLRAKLARAGLISPSLYIDLVADPEAQPAELGAEIDGRPVMPTIPTNESDLLTSAQGVMDKVASLPVEDVMESVITLIGNVNALITDPEFQAAPGNIGGMIAELRESGMVDNVNAAVGSLRNVADQIAAAQIAEQIDTLVRDADGMVQNFSTASDELPELLASFRALSDKANGLPLDDLVASATALVDSADAFVSESGMSDLPPRLADTLRELELTLQELREGGAVRNVNATLASASEAAQAIQQAADDLPALVDRLNQSAANADAAIASIGPNSALNRETLALIAEVRAASRSVQSLAQELQRRPNSVIFGR